MKKIYIEVPKSTDCSPSQKVWHGLVGILLFPFYLAGAWLLKGPGIKIYIKCIFLSLRLFFSQQIPLKDIWMLICFPMESTRYFEFDEILQTLKNLSFKNMLDVSSPRLAPLMILLKNKTLKADFINPDTKDLEQTKKFIKALKLENRCSLTNSTLDLTSYEKESFDLITCISVLEHIPDDEESIKTMWALLQPGGRLILTLPCLSKPLEQYISQNDYGVLSPGPDGYTFWQRYYDDVSLNEKIYSITGIPKKQIIYGEKKAGNFYKNAHMKRLLGSLYPHWRESYMMAKEYRYFEKINDLPGEGVIFLEFVKS